MGPSHLSLKHLPCSQLNLSPCSQLNRTLGRHSTKSDPKTNLPFLRCTDQVLHPTRAGYTIKNSNCMASFRSLRPSGQCIASLRLARAACEYSNLLDRLPGEPNSINRLLWDFTPTMYENKCVATPRLAVLHKSTPTYWPACLVNPTASIASCGILLTQCIKTNVLQPQGWQSCMSTPTCWTACRVNPTASTACSGSPCGTCPAITPW